MSTDFFTRAAAPLPRKQQIYFVMKRPYNKWNIRTSLEDCTKWINRAKDAWVRWRDNLPSMRNNLHVFEKISVSTESAFFHSGSIYMVEKTINGHPRNRSQLSTNTTETFGLYARNSKNSCLRHRHFASQTIPPWWKRLAFLLLHVPMMNESPIASVQDENAHQRYTYDTSSICIAVKRRRCLRH